MDDLDLILERGIKEKASDIHLGVGRRPIYRIHGNLVDFGQSPLTKEKAEAFVQKLTPEDQQKKFEETHVIECAYSYGDGERFRVSVFQHRGSLAIALRLIPKHIMTMEEIGLPSIIHKLLDKNHGLILVTGPTGSGKSTTLASMIHYVNQTDKRHIITIEDPIEYLHADHKSIINQRELGEDTPAYSKALIEALRQDPDVILVGEMRDLETIETALRATETGHLVLSTLHTFGAARTLDRVIDAFPSHQQNQVRVQLSMNLAAVISQQLIPRKDQPGRIAVFELMILTPAIQNLIRKGQTYQITNEIQTGAKHGMITLEHQLLAMHERGILSKEDVLFYAIDTEEAVRRF